MHPGPRAERIFKVLDVSGDGDIEYAEFLAAFKPPFTYQYDLEAATEAAAGAADLVVVLVDPKAIHYNARELSLIGRVHARCAGKMRVACYLREALRTDSKLRSHLLPATRHRLEQAMLLPSNALVGHLPNLWVPAADGTGDISPIVDNQLDEVLIWIKDALLALENGGVDETEHSLRVLLDALWSCADGNVAASARSQLSAWLQAWRDATGLSLFPSLVCFCPSPLSSLVPASLMPHACRDLPRATRTYGYLRTHTEFAPTCTEYRVLGFWAFLSCQFESAEGMCHKGS